MSIRDKELAGSLIGQKLIDVTQHDPEEFDPKTGRGSFVEFLFQDGTLRIYTDGRNEGAMEVCHADACDCSLCKDTPS